MDTGKLLLVAGEASGDLHGARLLQALRRRRPKLTAFGLGGDELRAAGLEAQSHSGEIAVVGLTEALRVLPKARRIFRMLLREVDRRDCRVAVLIDSPDFNLRLAGALKRRGLRVVYYVSPQVWAWRRGRVRTIARTVDRMLVLFPFEVDFYRRHGVDALHVGHPLVDEVPRLPHVWDQPGETAGAPRIALLPGSRRSEIEANLPVMLGAARRLVASHGARLTLIRAPSLPVELFQRHLESAPRVEVRSSDRFSDLAVSHLALCASGTATLETALVGTPMVVIYRVGRWTWSIGSRLVRLPHVSLVNLVLGGPVVPELLQQEAHPERIAAEAAGLLEAPERIQNMRAAFVRLRSELGEGGASDRAAAAVSAVMDEVERDRNA